MPVVVDDGLTIPDAELAWRFTASGGPGGQHANRSHTRVELLWDLAAATVLPAARRRLLLSRLGSPVSVVADDERSQARNREVAQRRLAQRVREASVVAKPRRATRPTAGSKRRRLHAKRQRSQDKQLRRRPGSDD